MNVFAITLHGLAAGLWVGGMFFAYVVLRPSIILLEPHRRLTVWAGVFRRFFPWVWIAVLILPVTGTLLIYSVYGGFATMPVFVHIMQAFGWLMIALFVYMYFRPYRLFKQTVKEEDWGAAGAALNRVRHVVLVNLVMGLGVMVVAYAGRYGLFG